MQCAERNELKQHSSDLYKDLFTQTKITIFFKDNIYLYELSIKVNLQLCLVINEKQNLLTNKQSISSVHSSAYFWVIESVKRLIFFLKFYVLLLALKLAILYFLSILRFTQWFAFHVPDMIMLYWINFHKLTGHSAKNSKLLLHCPSHVTSYRSVV